MAPENNTFQKSNDEHLNFEAINEGLGFHPFSEGLPYSPQKSKPETQRSNHIGATAAGKPQFVFTKKPARQPSLDSFEKVLKDFEFPQNKLKAQTHPKEPTAQQATKDTIKLEINTYGFSYLLKRICAFIIDFCFSVFLGTLAILLASFILSLKIKTFLLPEPFFFLCVFLLMFNWAIITAQELVFNNSIGKRLLGLSIAGPPGLILLRSVLFIPSCVFLSVGLFWAIFDSKKRCLHDVATGLQPNEYARL